MPLRTIARMTAFSPGQSPPPVSIPMRMASGGTYIAKAARPLVVALVLLGGCGGGGSASTATPASGPLSVYLSVPAHGVEASTGAAVAAGARLALTDAHGRAGERAISLVQLDD